MFEHDRFGPVLQKIISQLQADPERVRALIELSAKWEQESLTATLRTSSSSATPNGSDAPVSNPKGAGAKKRRQS